METESIKMVQEAYSEGIKMLNASNPSNKVLQLKGYEAFEKMAQGKSSKLIIPSEMGSIASLASVWQTTKDMTDEEKIDININNNKTK